MQASNWYAKTAKFWQTKPPTVDGMLDGLGALAPVDEAASNNFLSDLFKCSKVIKGSLAIDCGAGIGRVTKSVLLRHFEKVDFQEQSERYTTQFWRTLPALFRSRVENVICCPLQNFVPSRQYDCIWIQWVIAYLRYSDLLLCLRRCASSLRPGGYLIVCVCLRH